MIEIVKAILFGLVEGITEWLPVSSTGHMILLDEFVNLNVSHDFMKFFEVVIQFGAVMAVVVLYFKKIFPWGFKKTKEETIDIFKLWGKILISCIPAAIIGILLDDWIDDVFFNYITVAITLILYGIIFIIVEKREIGNKKTKFINEITYRQALLIGVFQLLALIPGTSRSGATIIGALLIGLDRKTAAEYTFYLAIPVMAGASLLKFVKYIKDVGLHFTSLELSVLIVGCAVAFTISVFVVKFLMSYIKKHDFKVFGFYRIALGILVLLYFLVVKQFV